MIYVLINFSNYRAVEISIQQIVFSTQTSSHEKCILKEKRAPQSSLIFVLDESIQLHEGSSLHVELFSSKETYPSSEG